MQTPSIARRLNLGLVASLLLGATLLGVVATLLFERALRDYALNTLQADAQSVLAAIERGPQGLQLDTTRLIPSYRTPLSGRYFIVDIGGNRWRSRSLWDSNLWADNSADSRSASNHSADSNSVSGYTDNTTPVLQKAFPSVAGPVAELIDGPEGQRLLCLRADYRRHGSDVVIVVAADVAPLLTEFRRIGLVLLALAGATVLLLVWLQHAWMRRALSPLTLAQQQLQQLQHGKRETLDTDVPTELRPLLIEINRLLQFTRQSLQRSRHALGNLGHALKTPLAVLVSLADRADPALRDPLQQQLAQMQQRISRELARARTAGNVVPGIWFSSQQDLPLLIESLRFAHPNAPTVTWNSPAQAVPLERDDLLELLGNLLDNACKWAQQTIALTIHIEMESNIEPNSRDVKSERARPSHFVINLQDDGPGIDESLQEQVLVRGSRLDEHIEGHGLGLGIVNDIVAAYGGDIQLARASLGGLQIIVRLPMHLAEPPR